jgi:cytochrome c-type biogenesis protein
MRFLVVTVLVALLLTLPATIAETPSEAAALWTEQYGTDMVEQVTYSPLPILEGELPAITIRFTEGHNISEVSAQYCRITGPTGGATCFRAGLESVMAADGQTWTIDLAEQGDEPFPLPLPVATEHLGVQFFLTFDNGAQVNFPQGLPFDHPWFYGTNEEFIQWDETQYFTFDVDAKEVEPVELGWIPWAAGSLLAAVGAGLLYKRRRNLAIVLVVVALVSPLGFLLTQTITSSEPAPDFTLTDTGYENGEFRGEQNFSLSDYEGQTVVIDFMAYNCAACRHVTPTIMEPLWEDYGARDDFSILTIDVGEFSNFPGSNNDNLVRWQTVEFDGQWRHALDDNGAFLDYVDLGALGLPSVFILDENQNIIFANTGNPSLEEMREVIESSFEGQAVGADLLTVGILGLALIAGISSFFAPCSIGLIPAYMGFLLKRQNEDGKRHSTIPAGLATAGGIVSLYAVLAVVLWFVGDSLGQVLPWIGPVMGVLLIALGVLMLVGFDWEGIAKKLGMGKVDGRRGFFAFGVGYGLAAFGCTGPIFLPVLIAGFARGTVMGFMAFLLYSLAVSSLVVFAAYLVGAGKQTRLNKLLSHTKRITQISAILLIAGGAYLIYYDLTAFN